MWNGNDFIPFAYAPVERLQWGAALGCGFHTAQQGARCLPCQIHPAADRSSKGEPHEGVINECSWGVRPRKELYSGNAGQTWTAADIKTSKAPAWFCTEFTIQWKGVRDGVHHQQCSTNYLFLQLQIFSDFEKASRRLGMKKKWR